MSEPKPITPEPGTPAARASLYRRILEVTAAMDRIPKNGRNEFHKYNYATESDIVDGLRGVLLEHGLALLPPSVLTWERTQTTKRDGSAGDDLTRVQMQFELADTENGEVYTACMWGEGMDGGDKGFYKAYTGAVKYFLMKTFLIATGDDPEAAVQQESHRQTAPAQRPQPTAPNAPASAQQPSVSGDLSFNAFWPQAREITGATDPAAVHQALGVESMKDWMAQGKTLRDAIAVLLKQSEREPAQIQAKELFATGSPA